jgi:ATP-dependent Clp protease, protease subunit
MNAPMQREALAMRRRILTLGDNIQKPKMDELRTWISILMNKDPDKEIYLLIDSGGGACKPALAFYDYIRLIDAPVVGIVNGKCGSSAVTAYLACKRRLATPNSRFWVHDISTEFNVVIDRGRLWLESYIRQQVDESIETYNAIREIYRARTGHPQEELDQLVEDGQKLNKYFSADEAKKRGFVTEIVSSLDLYGMGEVPVAPPHGGGGSVPRST